MKYLIVFFTLCIVISCQNATSTAQSILDSSSVTKLSEYENYGLTSKQIVDTVLLGFRFGMTNDQYMNHRSKLIINNTLNNVGRSRLDYYQIKGQLGTYKGEIVTDFYNGKLMGIELFFDDPNSVLLFSDIKKLITSKYGEMAIMDKPLESNDKAYVGYWFKNNLKIKLANDGGSFAYLKYIDLRFESLKAKADSIEKVKKENETKKNL